MARDLRIELDGGTSGEYLSPETVRLEDLLEVIHGLTEAVKTVAGPVTGPAARISLTRVDEGSCAVTLQLDDSLARHGDRVLGALERRELSDLPYDAAAAAFRAFRGPLRKRWRVTLRRGEWSTQGDVVVSELEPLAEPERPAPVLVRGTTSLYGKCVSLGGANKPKIEIQPLEGGSSIKAQAEKVHVQALASRIYEIVGVRGEATWDAESWEIVAFKVTEVLDYKDQGIMAGLTELQEAAGDAYDTAEARSRLRQLRSDEDQR